MMNLSQPAEIIALALLLHYTFSGVDYTHERLGGPGTVEAYQLAYGTGPDSRENKEGN